MKKGLFLILALLVAACSNTAEERPMIEVYQCGDYTVYLDPYLEKTYDLSGGLLTREGMDAVELNSSDIVKWPVVICADGETEIWSKTLKTADSNIIFHLTRYEKPDRTIETKALFSDKGLFRNGAQHIECEFLRAE